MIKGSEARRFFEDVSGIQIQPAGVDLRLDRVFKFQGKGFLGIDERYLPMVAEISPENDIFELEKGEYKIRFYDIVSVPADVAGLCLPRSSLLRMGASINCALWDPGYRGRGEALLVVYNGHGIRIQRHARIAQMYFIKLTQKADKLYDGIYNNENL
ncbi:MAG: deoxyuridine 5'-triphosphate nucleotidohydrolase [Caldisphaeraceae archaeon]|nr:deoxyuridine 5'-triphosphate nucleotidohydrolase [Caldisphaeraceae archaeon]MEB3691640.1 deoxyuridine 5'-triphosphate nucleotidohydrolase [Caldisphaeraceae archaeon]MEB3798029.1 deoxyuridine 5'-triphosphate nucleotidohydrolase [Caldisphaeraceae archaeon]